MERNTVLIACWWLFVVCVGFAFDSYLSYQGAVDRAGRVYQQVAERSEVKRIEVKKEPNSDGSTPVGVHVKLTPSTAEFFSELIELSAESARYKSRSRGGLIAALLILSLTIGLHVKWR